MMPLLKRKITESISSWKRTKTNQGLLITGARQVGKTSRKHAALDALLTVENYILENPVVLHTRNVEVGKSVTYLPLYMAAFL